MNFRTQTSYSPYGNAVFSGGMDGVSLVARNRSALRDGFLRPDAGICENDYFDTGF
jgi:hypothetical protein